jgi:hypothetical protein
MNLQPLDSQEEFAGVVANEGDRRERRVAAGEQSISPMR